MKRWLLPIVSVVSVAVLLEGVRSAPASAAGQAVADAPLRTPQAACPASRPPTDSSPAFGPAVGAPPVWAIGFDRLGPTLHVGGDTSSDWYYPRMRHGWGMKMLWVTKPGYTGRVTLRGWKLRGTARLWFVVTGDLPPYPLYVAPTDVQTLDARHPAIPSQRGSWTNFPSTFIVPESGCYVLEARWSGGAWRVTFAAATPDGG